MAVVITVAQQKGGSGKSMMVASLAACLAANKSIAVLDIDPQHSVARWHRLRAGHNPLPANVTLSEVSGWRVAGELDRLKRSHDIVLVDTPPVVDSDSRRAIRAADLVMIPLQPSAPDLWAAEGTLTLAQEEKRRVCVVLNRVPPTGKQRDECLSALSERGVHVLLEQLGNRTAFSHAFAQGLGVTEAAPRTVAAKEVHALADSVLAAASAPATN